jgi:hypothetical protein
MLRSGSLAFSIEVKRVWGHRMLSTLILDLEQSMYSLVVGTWKTTGKTVFMVDVDVLLVSTDLGSYWRMAHKIDILVPEVDVGSLPSMSHLRKGVCGFKECVRFVWVHVQTMGL